MMNQLYLEYEILKNRPGLLGDVASFIGMLNFDILTVGSLAENRRGFLLKYQSKTQLTSLRLVLEAVPDLQIKIFHSPDHLDLLALKHGKRIKKSADRPPVYRFARNELDYLIDFLGEKLGEKADILIGFRGSPRIGKSEAIIAACVHANKPWILLSSTLMKKVVRTTLEEDYLAENPVLIVDAITTFYRAFPEHIRFVKQILQKKVPRVVEHPQILIQETDLELKDFDLIIELYSQKEDNLEGYLRTGWTFNAFDIS